jgi:hypothetical protein
MTDWLEEAKRKKEALRRDLNKKCGELANKQFDLSPEEQKDLAEMCLVEGLAAYENTESICIIDTAPKHLLKGGIMIAVLSAMRPTTPST